MTNVLHQPDPHALCRDDGVKGPCLHCPPLGWLLTVQGCNRPAVIYSFSSGLLSHCMCGSGAVKKRTG